MHTLHRIASHHITSPHKPSRCLTQYSCITNPHRMHTHIHQCTHTCITLHASRHATSYYATLHYITQTQTQHAHAFTALNTHTHTYTHKLINDTHPLHTRNYNTCNTTIHACIHRIHAQLGNYLPTCAHTSMHAHMQCIYIYIYIYTRTHSTHACMHTSIHAHITSEHI